MGVLTVDDIKTKVNDAVEKFNSDSHSDYTIDTVKLFGSYAEDCATPESDVDLLITFKDGRGSLFALAGAYIVFEEALQSEVDVVVEPIPEDSFLEIDKVVPLYAV